jgi:1-acyl-sn-glycerol-3-phosphate acyltransferase
MTPANATHPAPVPFPLLRGVTAIVLMALNTIATFVPLFTCSLAKLLLPFKPVRARVDPLLNGLAMRWVINNGAIQRLVQRTEWDVRGLEAVQGGGWVLVVSNHRSWVDILVLQRVLRGRLPFLKFFLKQELIWVPVMGLAWWALDFPFLRRHGPAALKKRPGLRMQDREAARRACERFRLSPTSVMTVPEGTRFTREKHAASKEAYRHLLPPKSGALAVALDAMGRQMRACVDITIAYPGGTPSFWDFLCGRCPRVQVQVREELLPDALRDGAGEHPDESDERAFRGAVQQWIDALWARKDAELDAALGGKV